MSHRAAATTPKPASPDARRRADPRDGADPPGAFPPELSRSLGRDGTLLAVIPVPGAGTSLVIVSYVVAASGGPPAPGQGGEAGLVIDHARRLVWADGREVPLTFQEFELLGFLSRRPGTVFSRAELVAGAWQGEWREDSRTVDVHVSRLRRTLGPAYGRCVATEYRVGYRFQPPA